MGHLLALHKRSPSDLDLLRRIIDGYKKEVIFARHFYLENLATLDGGTQTLLLLAKPFLNLEGIKSPAETYLRLYSAQSTPAKQRNYLAWNISQQYQFGNKHDLAKNHLMSHLNGKPESQADPRLCLSYSILLEEASLVSASPMDAKASQKVGIASL